jgi:hypothetical protein
MGANWDCSAENAPPRADLTLVAEDFDLVLVQLREQPHLS